MIYIRTMQLPILDKGVRAGSNTSTVALRVVEATKRKQGAGGYNWATLFLGDINKGA
jgi:hypothetical protein